MEIIKKTATETSKSYGWMLSGGKLHGSQFTNFAEHVASGRGEICDNWYWRQLQSAASNSDKVEPACQPTSLTDEYRCERVAVSIRWAEN